MYRSLGRARAGRLPDHHPRCNMRPSEPRQYPPLRLHRHHRFPPIRCPLPVSLARPGPSHLRFELKTADAVPAFAALQSSLVREVSVHPQRSSRRRDFTQRYGSLPFLYDLLGMELSELGRKSCYRF
jgi:hypothetical protein